MTNAARVYAALRGHGWKVAESASRQDLPAAVVARYDWFPTEVRDVAECASAISSCTETAWMLTAADFAGASDSAFAWNEWERMTLDAAAGDPSWCDRVIAFWNEHLPILLNVGDGYAYLAVNRRTKAIVGGREPTWEETVVVAPSFADLVRRIEEGDPSLLPWLR